MQNAKFKIIYEDDDLLVIDKPAGVPVFKEGNITERTLADYLIEKYPELKKNECPRYGIAHRLDKDTSGLLLVAKTNQALIFFQKQFKNREVEKKYLALVVGRIKDEKGTIETLIGRSLKDGKKQKVFLMGGPGAIGKRQAITEYKVIERFPAQGGSATSGDDYTLLEIIPKTGRKHQIRCHLNYINHPIAGDKIYGFKNQPRPKGYSEGLNRHFLHASYLKLELPTKKTKEFKSELPEELKKVLNKLKNAD